MIARVASDIVIRAIMSYSSFSSVVRGQALLPALFAIGKRVSRVVLPANIAKQKKVATAVKTGAAATIKFKHTHINC